MATLEYVCFVTTPIPVRLVALLDEVRDFCRRRAAVVGGENDNGVLGQFISVECLQHLANHPVGLHQEISVLADVRFALPALGGNDRGVRAGQRQVEEERFVALLGASINERPSFAGEVA